MNWIDFIIEYWYVIIGLIGLGIAIGMAALHFFQLPSSEQIAKVKEWLKYAVTEAEKALGTGTGQLKLRYVYDMFVQTFPELALIIPFDSFSDYVDEALEWLNKQLSENPNVSAIVKGE